LVLARPSQKKLMIPLIKSNDKVYEHYVSRKCVLWRRCTSQILRAHVASILKRNKTNLKSLFKPPGTSVPSWKMSHLSSRCRVTVPLFTCFTTDTRVPWLCSRRLKCSATGNPLRLVAGPCLKPSTERRCSPKRFESLRPVSPMYCFVIALACDNRLHQPSFL